MNLLNIMYLSDYTDLSNLLGAFHIFLTQNLADHSNLANLKIRAKISTKFLDFSDLIFKPYISTYQSLVTKLCTRLLKYFIIELSVFKKFEKLRTKA